MKWSFSKARMFSQCPRKWYYSDKVAHHNAKDYLRREAFVLKQLKSIYAWRGSLVDQVISTLLVPAAVGGQHLSEAQVIEFATELAENQLRFAREKKYREKTKTEAREIYCALYDFEYNGGVDEDALLQANNDIVTSLRNLLQTGFLKQVTNNSAFVASQRFLTFSFEGVPKIPYQGDLTRWCIGEAPKPRTIELEKISVSCTPDLILFYNNSFPLIVDWKVHTFAHTDSRRQLAMYAYALSRVNPHKDFPVGALGKIKSPIEIRLIEYQLLQNRQRHYEISEEDINEIEDYIFKTSRQMKRIERLGLARGSAQIPTARSANICNRCQFKKLCWRKEEFAAN